MNIIKKDIDSLNVVFMVEILKDDYVVNVEKVFVNYCKNVSIFGF